MITDKNEAALLELIKASLFGLTPCLPEGIDRQKVLDEAKEQTVVALVARAASKEFATDKEYAAKWEISAAQSEAHFMRTLYEQTNLVQLFADANIPFVIIKGTSAACYYPSPKARTMGDVDLLVPEDSFDAASSLMENNGYKLEHTLVHSAAPNGS